ncbi:MAG: hypothetical protein OEM63_06720 [Gammaproteobacteria bacterium]|nr:hypothetical protein [Gammaproteobacteria bacterium]
MSNWRHAFLAIIALVPLSAAADVKVDDLPENTVWYLHVDFEKLRGTESGKVLSRWIQWEVYDEINEELGVDLNKEVNQFTAFSDTSNGAVMLIDGPVSAATIDTVMTMIREEEPVEVRRHGKQEYFHVGDEERTGRSGNDPFDDLEDSAYFSFAIDGRILITGSEANMQSLLDNGGRVPGARSHDGALLVLSANQSIVQAGIHPEGLVDDDDDDDWESNIVRNTKQAALLVADESGQLAIEAQLESTDPTIAQSIAGIVNGLIGLQAFNSELGPEIQSLIRNTKVEVFENVLSINTVVDPELVLNILEH